jgi:hypothetical protein
VRYVIRLHAHLGQLVEHVLVRPGVKEEVVRDPLSQASDPVLLRVAIDARVEQHVALLVADQEARHGKHHPGTRRVVGIEDAARGRGAGTAQGVDLQHDGSILRREELGAIPDLPRQIHQLATECQQPR